MSVCGIDFGNESSVVAVAKKGQINIAVNEVSHRKTPSVIGYTKNRRNIGEQGYSTLSSNINNSIVESKRLIGKLNSQVDLHTDCKNFFFKVALLKNGQIGVMIEDKGYLPEQIVGALFAHFLQIAKNYSQESSIRDCVISCPPYFTDRQRIALIDSAKIAGLNVLRILNETTAVALNYGILRNLPEKDPLHVIFVDVGHASTNVALVKFLKGKLEVLGTASDPFLGGRDFDTALTEYFCKEIRQKYGIDPKQRPKTYLRLKDQAKKCKINLSALRDSHLTMDSLMDDVDVNLKIERDQFESICADLIERFIQPVKKVFDLTQFDPKSVNFVEVVGGSTRIPALKQRLESFFSRSLSTTCNGDESVSYGCALQAAALSPAFRVRSFDIHDVSPYPIEICQGPLSPAEDEQGLYRLQDYKFEEIRPLFDRFNPIPCVKLISFTKSEPFQIVLRYSNKSDLPEGHPQFLSRYVVNPPKPKEDVSEESVSKIKVKIGLDINGIVSMRSMQLFEELKQEVISVEEKVENSENKTGETESEMNVDQESDKKVEASEKNGGNGEDEQATQNEMEQDVSEQTQTQNDSEAVSDAKDDTKGEEKNTQPTQPKKKKKRVRRSNLVPSISEFYRMTDETFRSAYECEVEMANQDRVVEETAAKRNELESYVYDIRSKVEYDLQPYVKQDIAENFKDKLNETEDQLYTDEGYDSVKSAYADRLKNLQLIGDPILKRKQEHENREKVVEAFKTQLDNYGNWIKKASNDIDQFEKQQADSKNEKEQEKVKDINENSDEKKDDKKEIEFGHITRQELETVQKQAQTTSQQLFETLKKQDGLPKHEDVCETILDYQNKLDAMIKTCQPIISKSKPKPKPKPKANSTATKKADNVSKESKEQNSNQNKDETKSQAESNERSAKEEKQKSNEPNKNTAIDNEMDIDVDQLQDIQRHKSKKIFLSKL